MRSIFFVVAVGAATCATGYSFLPELRGAQTGEKREASSFQELLKAPEQQARESHNYPILKWKIIDGKVPLWGDMLVLRRV